LEGSAGGDLLLRYIFPFIARPRAAGEEVPPERWASKTKSCRAF
jgi:hypothetical protein